jgi:DNA-binding CsgD family transcriptional regulator
MDERGMLDLVDRIYGAVTDRALWPSVLETISREFHGASVHIARMSRGSACDVMMSHGCVPEPWIAFQRVFGLDRPPPFLAALPALPLAAPLTPESVEGEDAYLAGELYREVMGPAGVRYVVSAVLHREPGWLTFVELWRGHDGLPFRGEELERLGWLARHLGRAVALQFALESANAAGALLADVIDRFDRGAILVDATGRPRLINKLGRAVLDRGDGLVLRANRLGASDPAQSSALLELIREAAITSAGEGMEAGGMLAIDRSEGRRSYAVTVSPLSTSMLAGIDDRALALVLVADPDRRLPTPQQLVRLHRFTPAEARLATRLMLDETPAEAAKALGVSVNTARFHLRNLLAKTGARRQAELISLLRSAV